MTPKALDAPDPTWKVGDRVVVGGTPHMDGQGAGVVEVVTMEPTYGVVFDGMEKMGIHRWYVESELTAETAVENSPAAPSGSDPRGTLVPTPPERSSAPQPPVRGYALAPAEDVGTAPTLYLYDIVGVDLFGGIAARQVIDDLEALGPVEALDVRINSPGGDVFEGIAIYNALKRFPATVTIHIDGLAASIASLIAMAGDTTVIAENAMVMVHRPWTVVVGDAEEMRHQAETLDKAWAAMLTTYQRRTGRRAATVAQRVTDAGGEWWMTADEAVAEGFADSVAKSEKEAQVFGLSRFKRVPARLAALAGGSEPAQVVAAPRVIEIEAPRVNAKPREGASRAVRRRIVGVLRLAT